MNHTHESRRTKSSCYQNKREIQVKLAKEISVFVALEEVEKVVKMRFVQNKRNSKNCHTFETLGEVELNCDLAIIIIHMHNRVVAFGYAVSVENAMRFRLEIKYDSIYFSATSYGEKLIRRKILPIFDECHRKVVFSYLI